MNFSSYFDITDHAQLTVKSNKRGIIFFSQRYIRLICCIKPLLMKCKLIETPDAENDAVDLLLLLGQ